MFHGFDLFDFFSLIGWAIFVLIVILIWQKVAPARWKIHSSGEPGKRHFSFLAVLFAIFLAIALLFLGHQLWNDLEDWVEINQSEVVDGQFNYATASPQERTNYRQQLNEIASINKLRSVFAHAALVIPLLIIALALFLWLRAKKSVATMMVVPYFVVTLVFTTRLLWDSGYYLISEYQKLGLYVVLISLVVLFSVLVYVLQYFYQRRLEQS